MSITVILPGSEMLSPSARLGPKWCRPARWLKQRSFGRPARKLLLQANHFGTFDWIVGMEGVGIGLLLVYYMLKPRARPNLFSLLISFVDVGQASAFSLIVALDSRRDFVKVSVRIPNLYLLHNFYVQPQRSNRVVSLR